MDIKSAKTLQTAFQEKQRPKLPEEYKKIYIEMYKANRNGLGFASFLSQKMESWMHRAISLMRWKGNAVLEIGAGTLNQLKYELDADPVYDIVEPFKDLYLESPYLSYIRNRYADISEIEPAAPYDRILSIAAYEHIENLDQVLYTTTMLLAKNGLHCVAIPNEGHFLWKLGYTITTGLAFRIKYGLDYNVIMRHEHINNADEIEMLLKKYYKIEKCRTFGLNKRLCLYRMYICRLL